MNDKHLPGMILSDARNQDGIAVPVPAGSRVNANVTAVRALVYPFAPRKCAIGDARVHVHLIDTFAVLYRIGNHQLDRLAKGPK